MALKDITLGQYFPGNSLLHRFDPRSKIIFTVLFIAAIFLCKGLVSYGITLLILLMMIGISKVQPRVFLKGMKPVVFIVVCTAILNLFYTSGTVLWSWGILKITEEGIWKAGFMVLRILMLIACTLLLTYTTSPILLTDGLEKLLRPLKKLNFPVHELSMMMSIALRFIPTLIQETDKIISAQKARGADFDSGNLIQKAKALIPILIPLFISSFRRAAATTGTRGAPACGSFATPGGTTASSYSASPSAPGSWSCAWSLACEEGASMKRNIALTLMYDGTAYHGWQVQKRDVTVAETLEKALAQVVGHPVKCTGAGRTDAGVHAERYVSNFRTTSTIPCDRLPLAVNSRLPGDIVVTKATEVPEDFNAIGSCIKKEYTYRIYNSRIRNAFLVNRVWFYPKQLDADVMNRAAQHFVGTHDFASVRSVGTETKTTVRTVHYFDIARDPKQPEMIVCRVCADGFLYNMVRAMVGTCVYASEGKLAPDDIPALLEGRNRTDAGPTAPPQGLYMTNLWYPIPDLP